MNEENFRDRISNIWSEKWSKEKNKSVWINININEEWKVSVEIWTEDSWIDKEKALELLYNFFQKEYIAFWVKTLNNLWANYKILKYFIQQCWTDCINLLALEDEDWLDIWLTQHED